MGRIRREGQRIRMQVTKGLGLVTFHVYQQAFSVQRGQLET